MKLLDYLTDGFINTFGITQPKPEQQRTVSLIIGGFLLAIAAIALAVIAFLLWQIRHAPSH
jgi:hypothetical protein